MIDFENMSDDELDILVAEKLGYEVFDLMLLSGNVLKVMRKPYELDVCKDVSKIQLANYTGDWAAMGPVIFDNKILVSPVIDPDGDDCDLWIAVKPWHTGNSEICHFEEDAVSHKNPLRAAAIVFLMMEAE
ncbi:MAG: DUF2591 domain-containing protein [Acidiferrobacterales bacterium]|nr:DUF2591 domain-containing protein [Acidiferrobacterales bacterium]